MLSAGMGARATRKASPSKSIVIVAGLASALVSVGVAVGVGLACSAGFAGPLGSFFNSLLMSSVGFFGGCDSPLSLGGVGCASASDLAIVTSSDSGGNG